MLKKYILFSGSDYYPSGGWEDFVGDFDTLEEATAKAGKLRNGEWAHVVEITSGEQWDPYTARMVYDTALPGGWLNREEGRQRQIAFSAACAREVAAERKAKADAHEAMVEKYVKRNTP